MSTSRTHPIKWERRWIQDRHSYQSPMKDFSSIQQEHTSVVFLLRRTPPRSEIAQFRRPGSLAQAPVASRTSIRTQVEFRQTAAHLTTPSAAVVEFHPQVLKIFFHGHSFIWIGAFNLSNQLWHTTHHPNHVYISWTNLFISEDSNSVLNKRRTAGHIAAAGIHHSYSDLLNAAR